MILLNDKFLDNLFAESKQKVMEINTHYNDCHFRNSSAPIDVCSCYCYQKQIFQLGMIAQEELLYGGSDRG
jgi:hypothetical protein